MDGKNKFWKGVLVGALVTAFAGLIVIGMAAGIWVVGKGVMGNQTAGISGGRATPSEVSLDIDRISQKMELIQGIISENYLFEEDPEMVEDGIFMGMMAGLEDPYSTYYTEEDFQECLEAIEEVRFDHLGCFTYSREENTAAYRMEGQIPAKVKKERYNKVMALQKKISYQLNKERIGKTYPCLVTGYDEKNLCYDCVNPLYADDDIDGKMVLFSKTPLNPGDLVLAKVVNALVYDLEAEVVQILRKEE